MNAFKKHSKYLTLSLILTALLLVLCGHEAVVLFVSIGVTYAILKKHLSPIVFNSRFYRLIVSIVVYLTILQTVIISMWAIDHNFPLNYSLEITGAILLVSLITNYFVKRQV